MSSKFHSAKPDIALKRSQELLAVGKNYQALQQLYELLVARKPKAFHPSYEPILIQFVELCVDQRKGRYAKEGLSQYRILCQHSNIQSLEKVIKHFVQRAESKIGEAQAQAGQMLEDIEDLDEGETPESLLMSYVTGEDTKDRTDRAVVTPWLKFLWETYRTVLDILRNNNKVEQLYHTTAQQAFKFCLNYRRQTEFRRLCEILRTHLHNLAKYSQQANSISLANADSLQMHLDTRFAQLNTAVELELWMEAFRSVEDLHGLLMQAKKPPRSSVMLNYYDKLMQIFLVSKNYLLHAHAYKKYLQVARSSNMNITAEERRVQASRCLLAALSVPLVAVSRGQYGYFDAEDQKQRDNRLATLLNITRTPTRENLLKEIAELLDGVVPEAAQLYEILEVDFNPLQLAKKLQPLVDYFKQDAKMAIYIEPVYEVALTRVLQQLSQVYKVLKIETVANLAPFYKPFQIEKFILESCKRGDLNIRLNHHNRTLSFNSFSVTANNERGSQLNDLRHRLGSITRQLTNALQKVDTGLSEARVTEKAKAFETITKGVDAEHAEAMRRLTVIAKEKERYEQMLQQREERELRERRIREQKEAELEKQRLLEESRKREAERIQKEQEKAILQQKLKMAEEFKKKGVEVDVGDLKKLNTEDIISQSLAKHEQASKEMKARLQGIARKLDHTERAFRKEEIPLLEEDYIQQKKKDRELFQLNGEQKQQLSKQEFETNMAIRSRMLKMVTDGEEYAQKIFSARKAITDEQNKVNLQAKEEEKAKRRVAFAVEEVERIRKQTLQDLLKRQENLIKQKQMEERAAKRAEEEERAKLQREREEEAERRYREREIERSREVYRGPERRDSDRDFRDREVYRGPARRDSDRDFRDRDVYRGPERRDSDRDFRDHDRDYRGPDRDRYRGPDRDRGDRDRDRDYRRGDGDRRDSGRYEPRSNEERSWRRDGPSSRQETPSRDVPSRETTPQPEDKPKGAAPVGKYVPPHLRRNQQ